MFKDRSSFAHYAPKSSIVEVANGDAIDGKGIGTVNVTHLGSPVSFVNALHVPSLKTDLVSMTDLAKNGCSIVFQEGGKFDVVQDTNTVLSGKLVDGLMELDVSPGKSSQPSTAQVSRADGHTLHSRLGHPGPVPFSKVHPGVTPPTLCKPCILAKHHCLPYKGKFKRATERLEMVHSDLSGRITPPTLSGRRYYFKLTNSSTCYKFIYILHHKSEIFSHFMQFKALLKNQSPCK